MSSCQNKISNFPVIGFIGAGQMARAIAVGLVKSGNCGDFLIYDPQQGSLDQFESSVAAANADSGGTVKTRLANDNQQVMAEAEVVFLAVKPQSFASAVRHVKGLPTAQPLLVSVMAGVTINTIQSLTGFERIIRVMPNTPCLVGCGVAVMACSEQVSAAERQQIFERLSALGLVEMVEERLMDAVTGLSGSGPAYVMEFVEGLVKGGVSAGIPASLARRLALQTVLGSVSLMQETGQHPAVLREQVTSPGGTTIAGLRALEQHGFAAAVMSAVEAATQRARELAENFR